MEKLRNGWEIRVLQSAGFTTACLFAQDTHGCPLWKGIGHHWPLTTKKRRLLHTKLIIRSNLTIDVLGFQNVEISMNFSAVE